MREDSQKTGGRFSKGRKGSMRSGILEDAEPLGREGIVLRIIGGAVATCILVPFFLIAWLSFGLLLLPFINFIMQLIREEANRDGVQLVRHRILFKERELVPPSLRGPYPPCREWLKTAPRWVGRPVEENPRYRLWRGFLDTALHLSRYVLSIDKKRQGPPVLGTSAPASDDDLRKAGLL